MDRDAVGQSDAGGGVCATSGSGGNVARRIRVERRRDAVEVALHRLVDALGEGEVGDRIVDVEQPAGLGVDGRRLGVACRRNVTWVPLTGAGGEVGRPNG